MTSTGETRTEASRFGAAARLTSQWWNSQNPSRKTATEIRFAAVPAPAAAASAYLDYPVLFSWRQQLNSSDDELLFTCIRIRNLI
jgi:hypothetical protein